VTPVGALRPRQIDVRVVSATNRDPASEVRGGAFRPDLLFRLNGISIVVPPLRERRSEILVLAEMFMRDQAERLGHGGAPALTADAAALLEQYEWPGNVRELRNVAQRAVLLCAHGRVEPQHLLLASGSFGGPASLAAPSPLNEVQATGAAPVSSPNAQANEERLRIIAALRDCGGNQSRAAELLRIPRRTFVAKISAYNLPRPRAQR
jgi:DNA-binding NtrC family response regulator